VDYGIAIAIPALFYAIYAENRNLDALKELRRAMDLQFDGPRVQFTEVKDLRAWIEPKVPGLLGHTGVRHTGLKSVGETHKGDQLRSLRISAGALVHFARAPISEGGVK
jgi:hypothetical protein